MLWEHNHRRAFVLCKPLDKSCLFAGFYKTSLIWMSVVFSPKFLKNWPELGWGLLLYYPNRQCFAKHIDRVNKKRTGKFHILKAGNLGSFLEQELHVNWSFSLQLSLGCFLNEVRQRPFLETVVEITLSAYTYLFKMILFQFSIILYWPQPI